jgi:hypothetical protein
MTKLNREQLIELVKEIKRTSGCVVDLDGMINRLESSCEIPGVAELIFCPPDGKDLSAEEIVDIATGVQPKR